MKAPILILALIPLGCNFGPHLDGKIHTGAITKHNDIPARTREKMRIRDEKLNQVLRLVAAKRYHEAESQIQQLRYNEPNERRIAWVALQLHFATQDIDGQIADFEIFYGKNSDDSNGPENAVWLCRYGDALMQRGKNERAKFAYFQAIRCIPMGGNKPEFETIEEYGSLNKIRSAAYTNAAISQISSTGDGKWLFWLDKALAENPENKEALAFKADRFASLGRIDEANAILRQFGPPESQSPRYRGYLRSAKQITRLYGKRTVAQGPNTGINIPGYHRP